MNLALLRPVCAALLALSSISAFAAPEGQNAVLQTRVETPATHQGFRIQAVHQAFQGGVEWESSLLPDSNIDQENFLGVGVGYTFFQTQRLGANVLLSYFDPTDDEAEIGIYELEGNVILPLTSHWTISGGLNISHFDVDDTGDIEISPGLGLQVGTAVQFTPNIGLELGYNFLTQSVKYDDGGIFLRDEEGTILLGGIRLALIGTF